MAIRELLAAAARVCPSRASHAERKLVAVAINAPWASHDEFCNGWLHLSVSHSITVPLRHYLKSATHHGRKRSNVPACMPHLIHIHLSQPTFYIRSTHHPTTAYLSREMSVRSVSAQQTIIVCRYATFQTGCREHNSSSLIHEV
jgi:hypothetical protein